jgi:hypothetical protein
MGGMFTVVKVRDDLARGSYADPGWYANPRGTVARRISEDPDYGSPIRRPGASASGPMSKPPPQEDAEEMDYSKMDHTRMNHSDSKPEPQE